MNVQLLREQIDRFAERSTQLLSERQTLIEKLAQCFDATFDADALLANALLASKAQPERHWSGALFTCDEAINQQPAFGAEPQQYVLIASDGSQIMPDRHKPLMFAYVQAACACIAYGYPDAPEIQALAVAIQREKPARILSEEDLAIDENVNPAAEVSNLRDVMEIELLASACERFAAAGARPIVIADGSIVPFALLNERTLSNKAQAAKLLGPLLRALETMRDSGAIVAGYIDRPNSNAIVKTCALAGLPFDAIGENLLVQLTDRYAGIFDRHVIERVLQPRRRTALFDPNWLVNAAKHLGAHAMRACYVNLSDALGDQSMLARIEMPQWCATPENIATVTAILNRHANLSPEGYPFILKAAHEEAVVGKDDQREIESALEQAVLQRGIRLRYSPKQASKDLL